MSKGTHLPRSVWALALFIGLACGGQDGAPAPSGPSMDSSARSQAGSRSDNRPPTIESVRFEPERPGAGEGLRAVVRSSDPDGDVVRPQFVWSVNGERLSEERERVTLSRTKKGDRIEVSVTASDGDLAAPEVTAWTEVRNLPPRLGGVWIEPSGGLYKGGRVTARAEARDPDGDPVSYSYTWWLNGALEGESGPEFSLAGAARDDSIRVRAVASDGMLESNSVDSPELQVGNAPPTIVSTPSVSADDNALRYKVLAEDPDGDRSLRYSLREAPEGMSVGAASGDVEWRPGPDQTGLHVVEVVVEDGRGGKALQRFELTVAAPENDGSRSHPAAVSEP